MISRESCALRPIAERDLDLVRSWRNLDRIRAVMYTDDPISPEQHRAWFHSLKNREDQRYFVFEISGSPIGMVYFNPIDGEKREGNWGFYRGVESAPRGSGLALGWLGLDEAFNGLGLRTVVGETFAFNMSGIRFHERLGFTRVKTFRGARMKSGVPQDIVSFSIDSAAWDHAKHTLAVFS